MLATGGPSTNSDHESPPRGAPLWRSGVTPRRVRLGHVERLLKTLSPRDIALLETLALVRIASGSQLERLYFHTLKPHSRSVKRGQVLKRLVEARAVIPIERRIGTRGGGSDKQCYALDSAGLRVLQLRARADGNAPIRRPRVPGDRFVSHTLAVTELCVGLVELSRLDGFQLTAFKVEPRWPDGVSGFLAPDAYVELERGGERYTWWFEADLGTESLPTVQRKLAAYVEFVRRGQTGPDGVVPWVLIGVTTEGRQRAVQQLVNQLPEPASYLFRVGLLPECTMLMEKELIS